MTNYGIVFKYNGLVNILFNSSSNIIVILKMESNNKISKNILIYTNQFQIKQ